MSSRSRGSDRRVPSDPSTTTVVGDKDKGIMIMEKTNKEWVDQYQRLFSQHKELEKVYHEVNDKYHNSQKESLRLSTQNELLVEKFNRDKDVLNRQKAELSTQNEKLRMDVREKAGKIGDFQKALVETQKKADSNKEELLTKTKQLEKVTIIISDLQNHTIPELRQKFNKSEANLEVVKEKSKQLNLELDKAENQHYDDEQTIEKLRKDKNELIEKLARAERETREAEDARHKEEDKVVNLHKKETSLHEKISQLEAELLASQSKTRDLENELNRRLSEPVETSYNITVVESEPALQSAPSGVSFGDYYLKDEIERLKKESDTLLEKNKLLEDDQNNLKRKLDAASHDINKWENKCEDENREKSKLAALLENEKENYGRLKNEYNELKSKLEEAERTIEHDKKEMARKDRTIEDQKERILQLEEEVLNREDDIAKLDMKLEQSNEEMEKLHEETLEYQRKYADLDSDYKVSESEKESIERELDQVSIKSAELENKLRESEEDKTNLHKEIADLQQKLVRLEDDLDAITKDKTVLENQLEDRSDQSSKHRKVAENTKKKLAQAQDEAEQYKNELPQKNNKIDELNKKLSDLESLYDTCQTDLLSAQDDCANKLDEIKDLTNKIDDKEAEISDLNTRLENTKKQRDNKDVEIAGLLEKLQNMQQKRTGNFEVLKPAEVSYSYEQPNLDTDLGLFRQKIYELENENNRLKTIEQQLHSDIKDSENKIASLERDLNRAKTENEDWERKSNDMKRKIHDLENEEDELMATNTDLREKLADLSPEVEKLQKKVENLTLERDKLKEYLGESNFKFTQSKEEYNKKSLDFSEQVKVNSTLGKTVKKHEATVESLTQKCKMLEEDLEYLRPQLKVALAKNETLETECKELDRRNKKQKGTIDVLQTDVRKEIDAKELLEQDVESLRYKAKVADANNKLLTKQRNDLQSQADDLESKLRKTKPELEQTRNKLKEKDRITSRLESEVKNKDSQLNAAKRKNTTQEETLASLRKEADAHKTANEINRNHVKELQIQLQEMGNSMQTAVANVSVVHSAPPQSFREERIDSTPDNKVYDLEMRLKKSEASEDELKDQLRRLEDKLSEEEANAKKAQENVSELQSSVSSLQRKLDDLRKMLDRSTREKEDAKKELMETQKELTALKADRETDANQIKTLKSVLDQSKRHLSENHEKLLSIDEEHVHLRLLVDDLNKDNEDLKTAYEKLQIKKNELENTVEVKESNLKSSQQTCDTLREEKIKAQQELNELRRTTLADLKKNLTRMQGERDRALEDGRMAMSRIEDLENQLAEAMTKRKELERDNDDLEAEIRQLKNEIEANRKNIEDLEDKIKVLNLELERDEEDIDILKRDKIKLEDEIADLQVKLAEKQDVINIAPMQVANVETTYAAAPGFDFGSDPDTLKDLEDLKQELQRSEKENEDLLRQRNDYKNKLGDSEGKCRILEADLKKTENRVQDLEKMLRDIEEDLNLVNDKYHSAERERQLLMDTLQDAQTNLSTAEAQQAAGSAKLRTLEQQLEAAQKDLLDKNDIAIEKQRKINELYAILESGGKDTDRLKQFIEQLREDVDLKDRDIAKLQKTLRDTQENLAKLQAALEDMEGKLNDTEHEREEFKMKADGLEIEIEVRDKALEEAEHEVDETRDKLKAAKKEIDTLRSELKDANVSLRTAEDEKRILEKRIAELQATIEQRRKELSVKDTAIIKPGTSDAFLTNKLAEYRTKYQDVCNEKMRLELALREKDNKISQVSGPSDTLREERDRLKDEVIRLEGTLKETKKNYQKAQRNKEEVERRLMLKDSEIKRLEDKIAKLEEEKEKMKKDFANLERKNSDLKVEYEKLKYEKNKGENDLSLLNKKYQALQNQMNTVDVPRQNQDVVSRKKYQELEARCQDALREKERAKSDMAAYRTKMARLEADLTEHKRERHVLEDERDRLSNSEVELKNKLQKSRDRHKEDKDKMLDWRKNNFSPLEQELQRTKGLIKKFEKTDLTKTREIEFLKDELAEHERRIDELEDELKNQDVTDAAPLNSVNIDIRGDSEALQRALEEKEDAVKDVRRLKRELSAMKDEMEIQKTQVDQQKEMIDELKNMNDRLNDEIRQIKKGTWDQQGSYNKLIKENSELAYQVNTLKEDKEELEKDIQELRDELNDVKGEHSKLMIQNKDLKMDLQQLELNLRELEIGHKRAKDDNEKIRSDLAQTQSENADLKHTLNRRDDEMIQAQPVAIVESAPPMLFEDDAVDGIKQNNDKLTIELEAAKNQIEILKNELDDRQERDSFLQDELTEARKRLKEDEADIKNLEAEIGNLRHELDLANQNCDDQRNENQDLLDAKENLQTEVTDLRAEVKDLETELQKLAKEKADLERELKRAGQAPIERRPSRDIHNEKEKRIRELSEKVVQLERDIQNGGYELSSLREENDDLQEKINSLKIENKDLRYNISQLEQDNRRDNNKIVELEKENQELQDRLHNSNGEIDSGKDKDLTTEENKALLARNKKLQNDLEHLKQEKANMKRQLDEYSKRLDDNSKQLAVQITKFVGDQSETFRKDAQEKDNKIDKLQQEKFEVEKRLQSLIEELDAAKSNLSDVQKQNEILHEDIKTLEEDKAKLDNKLVDEMNFCKVKTAELEAEQDILTKKIKEKDDLVKRYEKQVQELREQLAMSVPSNQASTTLILESRKQRPHSLMLSYQEGLMNRPGGLYRSTSESSLPNGDISKSSDSGKSDTEYSQIGELLSKDIPPARRSMPSASKDHVGETVEATSKVNTESEPDYAAQLRSSTPVNDNEDVKSSRKPSDRDSGSQRYGGYRDSDSTRSRYSTGRDRDRDSDSTRSRESDRADRRSERGKDHNRAECQQS